MTIFIDNQSGVPIYDQIFTQIRNQILSGELKQDSPLPSIRNLARDMRISVITTRRAYDELESGGYIYTLPGKGSFVSAANPQMLREENLMQIEGHIREIYRLAAQCGIGEDEIIEMYRFIGEEQE